MKKSGILMPVSSLPSAYGIGALDSAAYHFVDQLQRGAQRIWQILPLGMTGYGNSPYQPFSLRSGNPYFLSLEELAENGWLYPDELPSREIHRDRVDYGWLYETRMHLLHLAFSRSGIAEDQAFLRFQQQEEIQDHALYMALKDRYHGAPWYEWPQPLRFRDEQALAQAKQELCEEMAFHAFTQYVFEQQWMKLKRYANQKGIEIIGDLPFHAAYDSVDVWAHPQLFMLNARLEMEMTAGCAGDRDHPQGQNWGCPLYRWEAHAQEGWRWWIGRYAQAAHWYDGVRADHAAGCLSSFAIPYGEDVSLGQRIAGPGTALFSAVRAAFPDLKIIVENDGLHPDVTLLASACALSDMRVMQTSFDYCGSMPDAYPDRCICYSGTHDQDTLTGWLNRMSRVRKDALKACLHTEEEDVWALCDLCIRTLMDSACTDCIIPMQDWLHLDSHARINAPGTLGENWMWRMHEGQFHDQLERQMAQMSMASGRQSSENM